MPDFAVVLSLPTESVAIRAVVGSLVGLALGAVLLHRLLTAPRVRFLAALVPVAALLGAVALSWKDPLPPWLAVPSEADDLLELFHGGSFLDFQPLGWALLVAWLCVATARVARRVAVLRRTAALASAAVPPRDLRVAPLVGAIARGLRLPVPRVGIIDGCPGGAIVVGIRQPRVVVDAELLGELDDEELEGMLAHELAHIRRRDNLIALAAGLIRDVCLFIPGGRWVTRRLCIERELAADQLAAATTRRPGALASGLLKVLDRQRPAVACAAFAAPAAVISRVERLVDETPTAGQLRSLVESGAVALALTAAVAAATYLPSAVAQQTDASGNPYEGLAVAFIANAAPAVVAPVDPVAFEVFRSTDAREPLARSDGAATHEAGREFHPSYLSGDRSVVRSPIPPAAAEGSLVRPQVAPELVERWGATPVVQADGGLAVYRLHRLDAVP